MLECTNSHNCVSTVDHGGCPCRGKDKEIALLRAALVERDGRLQAGRAELLQARMQLQEKDEELVTAYQRLTEACQQRSAVRAALIGTQTELAATSAELDAWTHELATFQTELADMVRYYFALPSFAQMGTLLLSRKSYNTH